MILGKRALINHEKKKIHKLVNGQQFYARLNYNNVIDLNIVSPNDITVLPKIKFQKPILFDNHPEILRL